MAFNFVKPVPFPQYTPRPKTPGEFGNLKTTKEYIQKEGYSFILVWKARMIIGKDWYEKSIQKNWLVPDLYNEKIPLWQFRDLEVPIKREV